MKRGKIYFLKDNPIRTMILMKIKDGTSGLSMIKSTSFYSSKK